MSVNVSIDEIARANGDFRRVVATGTRSQVVLMCLQPGQSIGEEVHPRTDQIIVVVEGVGSALLDGVASPVGPGRLVFVPAGTRHNVAAGSSPLRLYTVYAPPEHEPGTVDPVKPA